MSGNRQIYTLIAMSFLFAGGFTAVSPVLPDIMSTFEVGATQAGLVLTAFAGGRMAFSILGGVLADRTSVLPVIAASCLLALGSSVLAVWTTSFTLLLVARVLQGVGTALYLVAVTGHIIDVAPEHRLARLLAWNQSTLLVGMAFGPTLGGLGALVWGYRGPFVLFAGYAALGLVLTVALLRSTRAPADGGQGTARPEAASEPTPPQTGGAARQTLRLVVLPAFAAVLVVSLLVASLRAGVRSTVVPLFAAEMLDFDAARLGLLLTVAGVANIAVMYPVTKSIERFGWRAVTALSTPLCALPLAAITMVHTDWQMYVVLSILTMISGFSGVVSGAAIAELAAPSIRKTMVGVDRTVRDFAFLISPVAATALAETLGYHGFFLAAGTAVAVMGLAVAGVTLRPPHGRRGGPGPVGDTDS